MTLEKKATKRNVQLTEEVVGPGRPHKVVLSLVVAIATLVLVNFGARRLLDDRTTNRTYWLIATKWRLLRAQSSSADYLVLGDSTCNQGVRPDILNEELGGRALNLCTFGDMLVVNDAWMLSRSIAEGHTPKHVVLVHTADVWPRGINEKRQLLLSRVPLPWGSWEKMVPPLVVLPEEREALFIDRYAALYAQNLTLTDWALHPTKMLEPPSFKVDDSGYMRNDVVNLPNARRGEREHLAFLRRTPKAKITPENTLAFRQIASLSQKHGFDVWVAMSPISQVVGSSELYATHVASLKQQLARLARGSKRFHFVLFDPVTFPTEVLEDADHVTHDAAETYTRALAQAIKSE